MTTTPPLTKGEVAFINATHFALFAHCAYRGLQGVVLSIGRKSAGQSLRPHSALLRPLEKGRSRPMLLPE